MPESIICVGHSTFDRIYSLDAVVAPPAKVRASAYLEIGGGMAANAAVAIARLGGKVEFWGPAGDDEIAVRMHGDFSRHGIDDTHLHRLPGRKSSHSAILVDARGERLIVNVRGDALDAGADWLPLDRIANARALLADVRWPQGSEAALTAARRAGVPTVLDGDTATRDVLRRLAGLADYCVFSEPGFAAFNTLPDTRSGLAEALRLGARFAAVTRGERGCEWLSADADGTLRHTPAFAAAAVDTTGAGDAFHGAFTLLLSEGRPLDDILRFASAAAALKVGRAGARSMPTRTEVEAFLQRVA